MKKPKSKGLYVNHLRRLKAEAVRKAAQTDFVMSVIYVIVLALAAFYAGMLWGAH
jgi:hypothetical protein